jgi:hypothetical protein
MFDFMDDGWTHHDIVIYKMEEMGKFLKNFKNLQTLTFYMGKDIINLGWNDLMRTVDYDLHAKFELVFD